MESLHCLLSTNKLFDFLLLSHELDALQDNRSIKISFLVECISPIGSSY